MGERLWCQGPVRGWRVCSRFRGVFGRVKAGILESGRKSRERAGMEQGSWFVQGCRLVEPRGFRSGDQGERCLGLFASKGESRERAKAGRRIDKEGVYIWDGTGVKC